MRIRCRHCGDDHSVPVQPEQFAAWKSGTLIQNAMPNLTNEQRELLITQTCQRCWDAMWRED